MMSLPPELRAMRDEIREYAVEYNLDFFEVIFELLDWKQINEVAAYGGFPNRYPHWRFGMEYERLSKSYAYGLSKIYEMVINNDPCYAYLLHSNKMVDQKMVMAHVYGHSDFFKCNQYFAHTNRKMMDGMANHRTRVMRHIDRQGYEAVEDFVDVCLSLENLIDFHAPAIRRVPVEGSTNGAGESQTVKKLGGKARPYMDRYINPPAFLEEQRERILKEAKDKTLCIPERPERDVLGLILNYAPLEGWQRDILSIVREEAAYYTPQGQTKIMNEGWACVTGDTRVLTDHGHIPARELVEQRLPIKAFDGSTWQSIEEWTRFPRRKTVRIETRRGFILEGSATHQILMGGTGEKWRSLKDLHTGDMVRVHQEPDSHCDDEIARCEVGLQDVYDFTIANTHRYVAHGFVNHNSYWHTTIMTQRALKDSEVIDYADHHSGTVAMGPNNFNPYKVGLELFRDIEERWNTGRFGKEYDECRDMRERAQWDTQAGLGREKIFEVRKIYNDVTFIDTFLTPEFCQQHRLFVYAYNITSDQYEIASREFEKIKQQLLTQLTNSGHPILDVVDMNYHNRGELLLHHTHEGMDLRADYGQECLKNLYLLWKRAVHVETLGDGVPKLLTFDGEGYRESRP